MLENTLNCKGDGKGKTGNNIEYGYGVFPLMLSLRAIYTLARAGSFEEYLLESGCFAKLHRAFRDFVENVGGGYVGGGGECESRSGDKLLQILRRRAIKGVHSMSCNDAA